MLSRSSWPSNRAWRFADGRIDGTLGALFSEPDKMKAILHAWLAWQEEPGCPYGTAIRAKYFGDDSPAATKFVAWFRRLFEIR